MYGEKNQFGIYDRLDKREMEAKQHEWIEMFLNKGIVYEDSIAEYLGGIKDGLVMNNAKKHVPVQESLERIAKSLQILVKNMDKTVTEENEKEYGE